MRHTRADATWRAQSQYIFKPAVLHEVAKAALKAHPNNLRALVHQLAAELDKHYPGACSPLIPSNQCMAVELSSALAHTALPTDDARTSSSSSSFFFFS